MTEPPNKQSGQGMYVTPKTLWFQGSGVWALVVAVGVSASAFTVGVNDMKHLVSDNGAAIKENSKSISELSDKLESLRIQITKIETGK